MKLMEAITEKLQTLQISFSWSPVKQIAHAQVSYIDLEVRRSQSFAAAQNAAASGCLGNVCTRLGALHAGREHFANHKVHRE